MKHINAKEIKEHLKQLKCIKSLHPERLEAVKKYWKNELNNRLKLN